MLPPLHMVRPLVLVLVCLSGPVCAFTPLINNDESVHPKNLLWSHAPNNALVPSPEPILLTTPAQNIIDLVGNVVVHAEMSPTPEIPSLYELVWREKLWLPALGDSKKHIHVAHDDDEPIPNCLRLLPLLLLPLFCMCTFPMLIIGVIVLLITSVQKQNNEDSKGKIAKDDFV